MALDWEAFVAAATGDTGWTSGGFADIDEWPANDADSCFNQNDLTDSFTGFDLSGAPGDKKGFRVWARMRVNSSAPTVEVTPRLLVGGTTEIWAPGVIATLSNTGFQWFVWDIPDSAFSGDPDISDLALEITTLRTAGGNQRLHFSALRISKSPFTAAEEEAGSVSGGTLLADYWVDKAIDLGGADTETLVAIPDSSGNGRLLLRPTAAGAVIRTGTPNYFHFPDGSPSRFFGHFGQRFTGPIFIVLHVHPEADGNPDMAIVSYATDFNGVVATPTNPNDKILVGITQDGGSDVFVIMAHIGDIADHKFGGTPQIDAWQWVFHWVQKGGGNEHLWENDDASPAIDTESGSNNLYTVSVGNRESNDRPLVGRVHRIQYYEVTGVGESALDDARDELVNGGAAEPELVAEVSTEADDTSDVVLVSEPALAAEEASTAETGFDVTLAAEPAVAVDPSTEADDTSDVALAAEPALTVEPGSIDEVAVDVSLSAEPVFEVEASIEADSGTEIALDTEPVLDIVPASVSAGGVDVALTAEPVLDVEPSTETDSGSEVTLETTGPEPEIEIVPSVESAGAVDVALTAEPVLDVEPSTEATVAGEVLLSTETVFVVEGASESAVGVDVDLDVDSIEPEINIEPATEADSSVDVAITSDPVLIVEVAAAVDATFAVALAADPALAVALAAEVAATGDVVLSTVPTDFDPFVVDGAFSRIIVEGGFSRTVIDGGFSPSVVGAD